MKKTYRYIIYFMIGIFIYYMVGADKDPEVLEDFHGLAPALIIGVVVLLFLVRYILAKKKKNQDHD